MAFSKKKLDPKVQEWLEKVAAEGRALLYGEAACPAWGTKFSEIESDGMSVGLELARQLMEQGISEQAEQMPATAGEVEGDEAVPAGKEATTVETEAGAVSWRQPRSHLRRGRKAFFPPTPGAGIGGR
jgi:hypothetical protein